MDDTCPRCGTEWYRAVGDPPYDALYCLLCSAYYEPNALPDVFVFVAETRGREVIWGVGKRGEERVRHISGAPEDTPESIFTHLLKGKSA